MDTSLGMWLFLQLSAFLFMLRSKVSAIDCFVCESHNGSDRRCHDPFNADYGIFTKKCQNGIEGRQGVFPGRFCIKMNGKSLSSGREMFVRTCVFNSMENQCGIFDFEDEKFEGCVVTCDKDACNGSRQNEYRRISVIFLPLCGLALITLMLSSLSFVR